MRIMHAVRAYLRGTPARQPFVSLVPEPGPVRVYAGTGRKAHLMVAGKVLCGWPAPADGWMGLGSDYEREFALSITDVCKLCSPPEKTAGAVLADAGGGPP